MGSRSSSPAGGGAGAGGSAGAAGAGGGRAARFAPLLLLASGVSMYVGASLAVSLFAAASAVSVAWGRVLAGGIVMLLWRRSLPRTPEGSFDWRMLGKAAIFGVVLGAMNLCFYLAIDRIALGTAVALEYLSPVLLAALTGRGWKVRLGIFLAAAGVFLISWAGVDMSDPRVAVGVGFALLAGLFWAFYIWLGRKIAVDGHGLDSLAWAMAVAALVYLPIGAPGIGPVFSDWKLLLFLVCVGVMSSALPYAIDQVVMKALPAATVALLNSLLPVTSLLVGLIMLAQIPNWAEVGGLLLVSAAVALATAPERPRSS